MAQKKLARHATVGGETYGPGDELPADVAEILAGNPYVWQTDEEAAADEAAGVTGEAGTSSGARLATHVTVGSVTYGPDDHIPDDVAEILAANPAVWVDEKPPTRAKARAAAKDAEAEQEKALATGEGSSHDANAAAEDEVTAAAEADAAEAPADDQAADESKPARTSRARAK